jgi:ankyrin repeat protein
MDKQFHPAIAAIRAGNVNELKSLVSQDPTLATGRSSKSHPTLLQCLVLDAGDVANKADLANVLMDAGADLNEPLVACGGCDNVGIAALLLNRGAAINGDGGWSPLEEALYWNSPGMIDLLLQRGASVANLRIAAGLGRTDLIESFFNADGSLKPEAGVINWPWGDLHAIDSSNHGRQGKESLAAKFNSWSNDRQSLIDNAFVYACMHGHIEAARLLLQKGANINAIPGGFDYAGSGLHYASLNGHLAMAQFLIEHGADASLKDTKVGGTPAGWADHGGHPDVKEYLENACGK